MIRIGHASDGRGYGSPVQTTWTYFATFSPGAPERDGR